MRGTLSVVTGVALSVLAGCAPIRMKVSDAVSAAEKLPVEGYNGNLQTFREKDLKIGPYTVTHIDRDWDRSASTTVGPWTTDASKKAYRFDVVSGARTLHGECGEKAVEASIAMLSSTEISMGCVCAEGETPRATLDLQNGAGSAQVAGTPYDVTPVMEAQGKAMTGRPLGYEFRGAQGSGAVEVSGPGSAWLPRSAGEDERFGLVCTYAGFLLYRPSDK